MKVAMHLTQPVRIVLQPPAPAHQRALDFLESACADAFEFGRVGIQDSHDAFVMSDQLARATEVKIPLQTADIVDLRQVVAERVDALEIPFLQLAGVAKPLEIEVVAVARHELVQREEFLEVAHGHQRAVRREPSDIQTARVARQPIECRVTPQEALRPIGHVLMTKRSRRDGLDHRSAAFTTELVVDFHRRAIAVALELVGARLVPKQRQTKDPHGRFEPALEIPPHFLLIELHEHLELTSRSQPKCQRQDESAGAVERSGTVLADVLHDASPTVSCDDSH